MHSPTPAYSSFFAREKCHQSFTMFGKLLQPKRFFYIKNALKAIGYRAPPWPTGGAYSAPQSP